MQPFHANKAVEKSDKWQSSLSEDPETAGITMEASSEMTCQS